MMQKFLLLWAADRPDVEPYNACLTYRKDDPFAVELLLPSQEDTGTGSVFFSRALLIDGMETPTGEGRVRVEPHIVDRDYITISLLLEVGWREFYAERAALAKFIDATFRRVPLGGELKTAARELDRWLAEVSA
jgi:hypothetical protein